MKKRMAVMAAAAMMASCAIAQSTSTGWLELPETGYWQNLLHLGGNFAADRLDSPSHGMPIDFLDDYGGEANQRPYPGQTYNLQGKDFTWTELRNDQDGSFAVWNGASENYVKYWHTTIFSPAPTNLEVRAVYRHDDGIRLWNNGAVWFEQESYVNGSDRTADVILNKGLNHITIKFWEEGGGDEMAVRLTDRNNNPIPGLLYRPDYALNMSQPTMTTMTPISATVNSTLLNNTGMTVDSVTVSISPVNPENWSAPTAVDDLTGNVATHTFSGLASGMYKVRFYAATSLDSATSEPLEIELGTLPKITAHPAVVTVRDAVVSATLVSEGAASPATVTLHWGTDNTVQNTQLVGTFATGAHITWTLPNLTLGDTYYYCFSAESNSETGWSSILPFTVASRDVYWKNDSQDTQLNTTSVNWNLYGFGGNAPTTFNNGDSMFFREWDLDYELTEDVSVNNFTLPSFPNYGGWRIRGTHALTLYGAFKITAASHQMHNHFGPQITGPGRVEISVGRFRLNNPTNNFTGGIMLTGGRLNGLVESAGATPFGSGAAILGAEGFTETTPELGIYSTAAGTGSLNALSLIGDLGAGRVVIDRDGRGHNIDLTIGALTRPNGAKAALNIVSPDFGAAETITLGNAASYLSNGIMPLWMATSANNGHYIASDGNGALSIADYASANIFTDTTLAANAAHLAARLASPLDLGGNTLTVGGAILGNNVEISNGALDFGAGDAYVYVADKNIGSVSTTLAGSGALYKYGSGTFSLAAPNNRNYIVQEGKIEFASSANMTVVGYLTGSGVFQIRGPSTVTLSASGDYSKVNKIHLHSGGLTIGAGVHVEHHGEFASAPIDSGFENSPGSIMTIHNGGRWTQTQGKNFHIGTGLLEGNRTAHDHALILTGANSTLDMNGGEFILGGIVSGSSATWTNTAHITAGAVLTNAAAFQLAHSQGGNYSHAIIDGGARIYTSGAGVGGGNRNNGGGGHYNTLEIRGAGTFWNNGFGNFCVGGTGGGNSSSHNTILVDDHALVSNVDILGVGHKQGSSGSPVYSSLLEISNGAKIISTYRNDWESGAFIGSGYGSSSSNNLMVIRDGGIWESSNAFGNATIVVNYGIQGPADNNTLRVQTGGRIDALPRLVIGQANANTAHNGLVEILDGGIVTLSGHDFSRITVGRANPGQPNPAHANGLRVASATADPSIINFATAPLLIGDNTSIASDRLAASANANWVRASVGGRLDNIGAITVGCPTGNSIDNRLILDGGAIAATTLTIVTNNILEVIINADGVKPIVLTGSATLQENTLITASIADRAGVGRHPIIQAAEGITNDATFQTDPNDPFVWNLHMSADAQTLYLSVWNPGTLLLIR